MEHVTLSEDGNVLVITLNRPAKYNALSLTMHAEMYKYLVTVMASEDAAEGVRSFMERRRAVFTGR